MIGVCASSESPMHSETIHNLPYLELAAIDCCLVRMPAPLAPSGIGLREVVADDDVLDASIIGRPDEALDRVELLASVHANLRCAETAASAIDGLDCRIDSLGPAELRLFPQ